MKILTITYAYPPYHQGGYEIRCRDVMERLKQRGHEVLVLTTRHPSNWHAIKTNEPGIHRKLHHKFNARWLPVKVLFDTMDTRFIRKAISDFKPDLVYLWQIATL
ncbi:MAG: glycosyltransferase, partial [Anaerolineales bacterium]|nr:glycosyltransferase [Anaerolineales bacterium]